MTDISNSRRILEICAVILTGLGKFVFVDLLPHKFWYIIFAITFWVGYIVFRSLNHPQILSYWGFQKKNFRELFLKILPIGIFVIALFFVYGLINDTLVISWHLFPILLLYPVWGAIQQFLMIAIIAVNLNDLKGAKINRMVIILITAILFSIVHYPSLPLVVSTFILGICYAFLFLQYRNIWVLGVYHGWLGAFFYFFVLKRDSWLEVLNTL